MRAGGGGLPRSAIWGVAFAGMLKSSRFRVVVMGKLIYTSTPCLMLSG